MSKAITAQEFRESDSVLTTEQDAEITRRQIIGAALDAGYYPIMISSIDGLITFLCSELQTVTHTMEMVARQSTGMGNKELLAIYEQMFPASCVVMHSVWTKNFKMEYAIELANHTRTQWEFMYFTQSRQDAAAVAKEIAEQMSKDAKKKARQMARHRVK